MTDIIVLWRNIFSAECLKIDSRFTVLAVSFHFPVLSHHQLSKAHLHCGRNCQPDVSGCPAVHGSDDFPELVVVCATSDHSSFLLPLAGTEIFQFLCQGHADHFFFLGFFFTLYCFWKLPFIISCFGVNDLHWFTKLTGFSWTARRKCVKQNNDLLYNVAASLAHETLCNIIYI